MATRARSSRRASAAEADELVSALLTASRALVGVSARSLAALEDAVTLTQFRTLVVLDSHDDINLNRLAESLDVTPSTAMRTIDRLLAMDLVTRTENPATRREVVLGLTPGGRRLVDDVTRRRRAEIARIVKAIPAERRAELVAALNTFTEAAGEPAPKAGPLGW